MFWFFFTSEVIIGVTLRKTEVVLEVPPLVQNPGCCVSYLDAVLIYQVLMCDMSINTGTVGLSGKVAKQCRRGMLLLCKLQKTQSKTKRHCHEPTFIFEELKVLITSCILDQIAYLTAVRAVGAYLPPRGAEDAEACVQLQPCHWLHLAQNSSWSRAGFEEKLGPSQKTVTVL